MSRNWELYDAVRLAQQQTDEAVRLLQMVADETGNCDEDTAVIVQLQELNSEQLKRWIEKIEEEAR